MYIEVRTEELSASDALALAVLIHAQYPSVLNTLALMTGTASAAVVPSAPAPSEPRITAEEAFGGDDAPATVAPSAEEAFGGPQHLAADASAATGEAGSGGATSGLVAPAGAGAGLSAATVSPSNTVDLDGAGLPWDGRIHSSNHRRKDDGTWFKRKGVSNDTVTTVEAELRARMAAGPLASTTATAPPPPASVAPTSSMTPPIPAVPAAPVVATAPPPPTVPPAPAPTTSPGSVPLPPEAIATAQSAALAAAGASPAVGFAEVMRVVVDATTAGTLTAPELTNVCLAVGIESPRDLLVKPALCADFLATLNGYLASKGA